MTEALRLAAEVKELAYEMSRQDVSAALTDYALKRQELQSAKETAREFEAAVDRLAALAERAASLRKVIVRAEHGMSYGDALAEQAAERDAALNAAYAEGRRDEREDSEPLRAALQKLLDHCGASYGTLSTSLVQGIARAAMKPQGSE